MLGLPTLLRRFKSSLPRKYELAPKASAIPNDARVLCSDALRTSSNDMALMSAPEPKAETKPIKKLDGFHLSAIHAPMTSGSADKAPTKVGNSTFDMATVVLMKDIMLSLALPFISSLFRTC